MLMAAFLFGFTVPLLRSTTEPRLLAASAGHSIAFPLLRPHTLAKPKNAWFTFNQNCVLLGAHALNLCFYNTKRELGGTHGTKSCLCTPCRWTAAPMWAPLLWTI